jgi:hypothetical protein
MAERKLKRDAQSLSVALFANHAMCVIMELAFSQKLGRALRGVHPMFEVRPDEGYSSRKVASGATLRT